MSGGASPHDHAGRIPLTVVGGFLGSGKTTLLNRLLQQSDGRRLAVLVNDFGALNIDAALVDARGADTVSLSNGCVCCQIGGDLTDALIRVIEAVPPPDAIVIEASGVADPWRIAQVGLADPALALDSVLVLVDATSIRTVADDPLLADTVQRQLNAGDLLVVNHCDRVDPQAMPSLRHWLDARWPGTPRLETRFSDVPAALLGAGGVLPAAAGSAGPGGPCGREGACPDTPHPLHPAATASQDGDHDHGDLFDSWSMSSPGVYRAAALRELLQAVPAGVLRLKGVLRTDLHGWAVLQFAGRHGSLRAWPAGSAAPTVAVSTFAAIGLRGQLPAAGLDAALRRCLDLPKATA